MRKRVVSKGNMRRSDFRRAVLTDTLPEEVPIIFSNDGFYKNLGYSQIGSFHYDEFVRTVLKPLRAYTRPYRFNVLKDAYSVRALSLIHPSAQIAVAKFYSEYDALVAYYASVSPASLRAPVKVGSSFFIRESISTRNRYRSSSIDTIDIETAVSNPASYFAYKSVNRAHEFFDSLDYLHLEKRFKYFRTIDVSKCFSSIYTHTLYWATDSVEAAKDNTGSKGFANAFDRLMQSMNYNETNGICIGPEVSRIFAEIILAKVDRQAIEALANKGLIYKSDYEFRRYVDDFYIFTHDLMVADRVTAAIQNSLSTYNMHVNDRKTDTIARPFITQKSRLIADTSTELTKIFAFVLSYKNEGENYICLPKRVFNSGALLKKFVTSIKSVCHEYQSGYETSSDYIISALTRRLTDLADSFALCSTEDRSKEDDWVSSVLFLVEAVYFFYTVNPTVRSSLNVARSVIVSSRLIVDRFPHRASILLESVVRWTLDLEKSITRSNKHSDLAALPIEVLNVLVPMFEVAKDQPLITGMIERMCVQVERFEYFELVTFLFLLGGRPGTAHMVDALFDAAKSILKNGRGVRVDSQAAHLCLDLLACPHIPFEKRTSWFMELRSACELSKLSREEAREALRSFEGGFWFVRWDKVDLLRLLRKKELSVVY